MVVCSVVALWFVMAPGLSPGQTVINEEPGVSVSIHEIKAKYENELMAKPGVVSIGIGQDADGQQVIIIGLEKEHKETLQSLPAELDGYRVRTEMIGPIKAQ